MSSRSCLVLLPEGCILALHGSSLGTVLPEHLGNAAELLQYHLASHPAQHTPF